MTTRFTMHYLRRMGGLALLALCIPAWAEDIDLFIQPKPVTDNSVPNVLFILDNTANWSQSVESDDGTKQSIFVNEKKALVAAIKSLATNPDGSAKFRVGLMMYTQTGNPNNNVDGGYVRAAVRHMNTATKPKYEALLDSLDEGNDKSNGGKSGPTMAEAYLYYYGYEPHSGNNKEKTDFFGNTSGTAADKAVYALLNNAIKSKDNLKKDDDGKPYNSPILPLQDDECAAGNFIIFISNGAAQDNTADTTKATEMLQSAAAAEGIAGATTKIPISPTGSDTNVADEWARFLKKGKHRITTYTLDVDRIKTGQGPGWTALLKSMANVSSGKYFEVTSANGGEQIAIAIGDIFGEIQAKNSVFASVSLPLSVSTKGTYLNQLYVGMFRPDIDGLPRWAGNLKQYKLGVLNGQLTTVDSVGADVINPLTGFVTECARSYWSTEDKYWSFRPQGLCTGFEDSNSPDGPITEKGAQAQRLRSTTTRTMKTCTTFACASLVDFNTTNVTAGMLGGAPGDHGANVNYQIGLDVNDEDIDGVKDGNPKEMRPSAHGDVVHSRPVAINYGTDGSPEVVVFYGGNDGVLRAINGNRSTAIGTFPAGNELWSFVPFEFHENVDRLRQNIVPISYEGNTDPAAKPKPYGLDGTVSAYVDGGTRLLYATARRGGRVVYSFDVSNLAANPGGTSLKWKVGCSNMDVSAADGGCGTGFEQLAQTWSEPKLLRRITAVADGKPVLSGPLLMMGGGYDPCEDADPITEACRGSSKGNRVYLIDAVTGQLQWQWATDRGVAADVFVVPDPDTGAALYAYVVDLGGNIYRISGDTPNEPFGTTAPQAWKMTKIASLGCDDPVDGKSICIPNRKFIMSADVTHIPGSEIYYVLVGSGDREKPVRNFDSAFSVQNHFFMVMDNPTDKEWLKKEDKTAYQDGDCDGEVICLDSLFGITTNADPTAEDFEGKKGWYLELKAEGEQVVTSAITVFGTTTFSTHEPSDPDNLEPGTCGNTGTARVYNISFMNAKSRNGTVNRFEEVSGGGLPPSPVAGMVLLDGSDKPIPFIIGADPDSPLQSREPVGPTLSTQPKSLTYWFIER